MPTDGVAIPRIKYQADQFCKFSRHPWALRVLVRQVDDKVFRDAFTGRERGSASAPKKSARDAKKKTVRSTTAHLWAAISFSTPVGVAEISRGLSPPFADDTPGYESKIELHPGRGARARRYRERLQCRRNTRWTS